MQFSRSILFGLGLLLLGNSSRPIDLNKFYADLNHAECKPQFMRLLEQAVIADNIEELLTAIEQKLLTMTPGLKHIVKPEIAKIREEIVTVNIVNEIINNSEEPEMTSEINQVYNEEGKESIILAIGYKTYKELVIINFLQAHYSNTKLNKLKKTLINFQKKLNQPDKYYDITHDMKINTARMLAEIDFELQRFK